MIKKLIPYLIGLQICIGLFHMGIGLEMWGITNNYDIQTLFILILALTTVFVYLRIWDTLPEERSWKIIFENAILLGIIALFFHEPWWADWEVFLVIYLSTAIVLLLLIVIFESQYGLLTGAGNWGMPDSFWKIWALVSLMNTITLPFIFILTHESLSGVWLFFGISWFFLWKEDVS